MADKKTICEAIEYLETLIDDPMKHVMGSIMVQNIITNLDAGKGVHDTIEF